MSASFSLFYVMHVFLHIFHDIVTDYATLSPQKYLGGEKMLFL